MTENKKTKKPLSHTLWLPMLSGFLAGLGLLVLHLARATSYFSDTPATCMNCHVMSAQYASWQHGSHSRVAGCNDCHVPQDYLLRHYFFKAQDGLRHSYVFTFRLEPQVIRIKSAGMAVVQENCIRCHLPLVEQTKLTHFSNRQFASLAPQAGSEKKCWDCHVETPHGRVSSLSAFPFARVPRLTPAMPEWISRYLTK
jgi:cytochrome c nitrite reductase small subunit